jgi:uncharacterized membrane protein
MKKLLLMLFSIVAIGLTSQAQDVTKVQKEGVTINTPSPFADAITIDEVFANAEFVKTKVVVFSYAETPEQNSISVTTTDEAYAEVLAVTYDLKSHKVTDKGKHIFEFGNRVREARIYTNLMSTNSGKFHIHRVSYTS